MVSYNRAGPLPSTRNGPSVFMSSRRIPGPEGIVDFPVIRKGPPWNFSVSFLFVDITFHRNLIYRILRLTTPNVPPPTKRGVRSNASKGVSNVPFFTLLEVSTQVNILYFFSKKRTVCPCHHTLQSGRYHGKLVMCFDLEWCDFILTN